MNNKENSEQKCIGRCDRIMRPGQLRQTLIIEINSVRFSFKAPPLVTGKFKPDCVCVIVSHRNVWTVYCHFCHLYVKTSPLLIPIVATSGTSP